MAPRTLNVTFAADSSQVGRAFDQIESKASGMGDKLSSIGTKLTAGVTLPIAAVGVKAFTMAADAEDATSAMNVVFGQSGDVIEKWAQNASTAMGLTSTEAKKAATDLAIFGKAGGLAGKDLEEFATQQTQLSADLASFKGTSVEEAMTAIGAAYRGEMEPIRAYGVLLDQQKIKEEAVALGLAKEGGELDNNAKLLATRSLILKQTADQQGDFARTSDGAANKMKILSAQFKEQVAAIGGQLIPIGQKLLGVVSKWLSAFAEMGPAGQRLVLMIGGIAAALGPVLLIGGKLVQAFTLLAGAGGTAIRMFSAFASTIKFASTSLRLLWILFTANPVGLIIAGIAALVAGLVVAYKKSETFRNIVQGVFEAVSQAFGKFVGYVQVGWGMVKAIFSGEDLAAGTGNKIWDTIINVANVVKSAFDGLLSWWRGIWPQFSEAVGHTWNVIAALVEAAWIVVSGIIKAGIAVISAAWRLWGDDLLTVLKGVWTAISGVVQGAVQVVSGIIKTVLAIINGDWSRAWEGIKQILAGAWAAIQGVVRGAMTALRGAIGAGWDAIEAYVRGVPGRLLRAIGSLGGLLVGAGRALMRGLLDGIISAWNSVASYLSGLASKIRNLKGPIEKDRKLLIPEGSAIMESLLTGLEKRRGDLDRLMGSITKQIDVSGASLAAGGVTAVGTRSAAAPGGVTFAPSLSNVTFIGAGGKEEFMQWIEQNFKEMLRANGQLAFQP